MGDRFTWLVRFASSLRHPQQHSASPANLGARPFHPHTFQTKLATLRQRPFGLRVFLDLRTVPAFAPKLAPIDFGSVFSPLRSSAMRPEAKGSGQVRRSDRGGRGVHKAPLRVCANGAMAAFVRRAIQAEPRCEAYHGASFSVCVAVARFSPAVLVDIHYCYEFGLGTVDVAFGAFGPRGFSERASPPGWRSDCSGL